MDKSPEAFRTISEVSDVLATPAHVLRFWESRFPQIRPLKRAGGRRYYRPADIALLAGIKKLLHDDGMTIRGVQKILRERGVRHVQSVASEDTAGAGDVPAPGPAEDLRPERIGAEDGDAARTARDEAGQDAGDDTRGAGGEDAGHDPDAAAPTPPRRPETALPAAGAPPGTTRVNGNHAKAVPPSEAGAATRSGGDDRAVAPAGTSTGTGRPPEISSPVDTAGGAPAPALRESQPLRIPPPHRLDRQALAARRPELDKLYHRLRRLRARLADSTGAATRR